METGADEGERAGDHICLLVASPCQPRAWPKHSLQSGWLGDPRHLSSVPPGHCQRASQHLWIKKSWWGKNQSRKSTQSFLPPFYTWGLSAEPDALEQKELVSHLLWKPSSTTSQLCNLGRVLSVLCASVSLSVQWGWDALDIGRWEKSILVRGREWAEGGGWSWVASGAKL